MATDYLDQLASFVVDTHLEDLDASTVVAAKMVLLDTVGAILAGSRLPENAKLAGLARDLSGNGTSTLFGHPGKVQPMFAALVNATAGVSLEVDEGNRLGGGHPSIHVTPGAIAVAEEQTSDGKSLLESIIVGYEVTARIGAATRTRPEIHSHGTWGTIGTAAATARLLGFDVVQTRLAMNLAVSMSPANTWTPCLEGATIRNLYSGRSSFQGILAAHLARCGFTAIKDGPADMYSTLLGEAFDQAVVVDGLGQRSAYRIQQNYFKLHACCYYNHPVLDAVHAVLQREALDASRVESIEVVAPPLALTMTNPEPPNMLAAKFSIPYAVAAAIVKGATDVTAFYEENLGDSEIRRLARRVKVIADPEMNLRRYDYPAASVAVVLKGGRTLRENVTVVRGDARNPAAEDELEAKFRSLTVDSLDREGAQRVIEAVGQVDALADIRQLTALLGNRGEAAGIRRLGHSVKVIP